MEKALLQAYAKTAVQVGIGLKKGQTLMIAAPIEAAEFARLCALEAYLAGARDVVMRWSDEQFSRIRYQHASEQALCDVKPWQLQSYLDYVKAPGGVAILNILAQDPQAFLGLDLTKIDKASAAVRRALAPWREYTMNDRVAWSIVAVPSRGWARKVFGDTADAEEKLWNAIFKVCRMDAPDPVQAWEEQTAFLARRRDQLNAMELTALHFTSQNGTDLTIGLADTARWEGAKSTTPDGQAFLANLPTEEIFTAPHKEKTEGVVYASRPYVYHGDLIEGLWLRFENGRVVEYGAKKNQKLLCMLLDTDEGSRSLGEVALVPRQSPINQSGILFYNTLFDENAACHIALGDGYPSTVQGGTALSQEKLEQLGLNHSLVHEDIMIGTEDLRIDGIRRGEGTVAVFRDGGWAF